MERFLMHERKLTIRRWWLLDAGQQEKKDWKFRESTFEKSVLENPVNNNYKKVNERRWWIVNGACQ